MQATNTRTLLLGENELLLNGLLQRFGSSASTISGESEELLDQLIYNNAISTIIVTSIELSSYQEQLLNRLLTSNKNHISIIQIVSLHDSLLTRNATTSLCNITCQSSELIDVITLHTPFFYEDLVTDRDSFFIHNINTHLNIVKYYGDGDMRLPLISRSDLISYIECLIQNHDATSKKTTHLYIRGDLIRLEYLITSLFGRAFQYENVNGRPGEERLAMKCSRLVQKYEAVRVDNQLFPSVYPLRWTEFLTH